MYHGGGGFIHSEVYNMPIWMRRFHINKINEWNTEQNKKMEKNQNQMSNPNSKDISRPNISPSSTYNISK